MLLHQSSADACRTGIADHYERAVVPRQLQARSALQGCQQSIEAPLLIGAPRVGCALDRESVERAGEIREPRQVAPKVAAVPEESTQRRDCGRGRPVAQHRDFVGIGAELARADFEPKESDRTAHELALASLEKNVGLLQAGEHGA